MKIKITKQNENAVMNAVKKEAGKAQKFVHDFEEIMETIEIAENRLENFGIPKARRSGVTVIEVLSGPSKSYKYSAMGTRIKLQRGPKDWFLVEVDRTDIYPGAPAVFKININEDHVLAAEPSWKRDYGIVVSHPPKETDTDERAAA